MAGHRGAARRGAARHAFNRVGRYSMESIFVMESKQSYGAERPPIAAASRLH